MQGAETFWFWWFWIFGHSGQPSFDWNPSNTLDFARRGISSWTMAASIWRCDGVMGRPWVFSSRKARQSVALFWSEVKWPPEADVSSLQLGEMWNGNLKTWSRGEVVALFQLFCWVDNLSVFPRSSFTDVYLNGKLLQEWIFSSEMPRFIEPLCSVCPEELCCRSGPRGPNGL